MILYKNYYVVKGFGDSNISKLNAFDKALMQAHISEANLVPVSSIIPVKCIKRNGFPKIKIGEIVFCVMARQEGKIGERISAGLAHVTVINKRNEKYGLVIELHGKMSKDAAKKQLKKMISEMAEIRKVDVSDVRIEICSIDKVKGKFGSVVVVNVYR